jgi:histidinol-phosphate aminotransferase
VCAAIDRLLPEMPRRDVIRASLEGRGALILTRSMEEACEISNRIAPEHLEISSRDPHRWEPLLRHAGAIFLGAFTSESLGDYCAGPNHVLPTSGTARFSSPLGVYDFQKRSSLIEVSRRRQRAGPDRRRAGLRRGPAGACPRRGDAHRRSGAGHDGSPRWPNASARTIRQDVQLDARLRDPAQRRADQARRDGEPVPPAAWRCSASSANGWRRWRSTATPNQCTADVMAALTRHMQLPAGCKLMLGNGSDELIDLLSVACDVPGATMLAPLPGFVMYEMSARLQRAEVRRRAADADFQLDEGGDARGHRTHRPALTYIAYPNNPTANLFDDAVIDRIVAAIGAQQGGLVVFDEAYQPFSSRTWLQRMAAHPHVLVMRTLSKFGLAGVRLGYLCGAAALIDEVDKVRPPYNVSVLNAEATLFALEHADEYERQAALLRSERERLLAALAAMPGVQPFPSEANMILVRVPDSKAAFEGMKARGVLIKHIAGLHPLLANCLRLTVGTPEENDLMIRALQASL